jgi:Co/Zn/Cd efflux system component
MSGCCGKDDCGSAPAPGNTAWRRALWIALAVNAGMFLGEIAAGVAAGSTALQADALDFLGDAANYGISLGVAGLALGWRSRAALAKGSTLFLLGMWVLASTAWHAYHGSLPEARVMGTVGLLALAANGGVAALLYAFRTGDANMRSVWICSRNDAIGNLAVLLAAGGVFGTGAGWPDIMVAAVMATLGMTGGWQILRQASGELRHSRARVADAEHAGQDIARHREAAGSTRPTSPGGEPAPRHAVCMAGVDECMNRLDPPRRPSDSSGAATSSTCC